MAYAAVISLKNTIHHFLNSSHISVVPTSRKILEFADAEVTSLQQLLKRLDDRSSGTKRLDALDGRIRDAVYKLEDVLEFHESDQFSSNSSSRVLSINVEEVMEEIHSLLEMMKKMKEEYAKELEEEDDDDDDAAWLSSSSIDFGVEMAQLSEKYAAVKNDLIRRTRPDDFIIFPILRMPGTGGTLIAKQAFQDLCLGEKPSFDCGAWVTVGRNYDFLRIMTNIFGQLDEVYDSQEALGDDVGERLYKRLKGRRCMIVLDDVWDGYILDYLVRCFPEQDNGSVLMFTTSLQSLFDVPTGYYGSNIVGYNEQFVTDCLRICMFGEVEPWPSHELEEAGKKIVRNTGGCRFQIVKVILFLAKADKTPECWNYLAADQKHPVFVVDDEISEINKIREDIRVLYNLELNNYQRYFVDQLVVEMNGFSDSVRELKMKFFPKRFFPKMEIISFHGMAGVGKTALVKRIFTDSLYFHDTNHSAWINLGKKYRSEEILVDILAQIYPDIDKKHMKEDEELVKVLCAKLSLKKCLIVLDDVWSQKPLHYLKKLFPAIKGKLLLTTRLVKVAQFEQCDKVHEVHLLNPEESWCLFCKKVFVDGVCPPKLEKVGKKISENCEGLPLLILAVANLLSKSEKTLEYWNDVVEKKNSLFMDAQNEISIILIPSYKSLSQHLKAFFLYMGVFPQRYPIPISKLINLWSAEGFLESSSCQNNECFVAQCLLDLVERSLVLVCQMNSNFRVKTYRLHSVFWHLSITEASKSMFFHSFNTYYVLPTQDIKSHRRLCIRYNSLLGMENVRNSIASISSAHSLICSGPPHPYEVPICFGLRLLRVMDALTIRLYEFPIEVVNQIHLRYLAFTCNEKLPGCISKLWNLQFFIIGRHLCINSPKDSSSLPIEIWDMKELRHLQIKGGRLPNPSNNCAMLPNLLTLLDVNAQSCTKRVLKRIPNVKKLGIRIELDPNGDGNPFHCLNHIWRLRKLESLKCVVVNPEFRYKVATPPAPHSMFPPGLRKLTLSGIGYPWEYMSIIGKLGSLEVLKLRCFAFRGPQWEINYDHFQKIKFLSIDGADLEYMEIKLGAFLNLEHLSFRHCYKLKKLPEYLPFSIKKVEIVDCNPFVVTWAKKMEERTVWIPANSKLLEVYSSWSER